MSGNKLKTFLDMEVMRAMCHDSTLLTSECEAAPVIITDRKTPAAGAERPKQRPTQSGPGHHPDPLLTPAAGRRT